MLGDLGVEVGTGQHQDQGTAEGADPVAAELARHGGGDRHRELQQVVEPKTLLPEAIGSDRRPERLLNGDLIRSCGVGFDHDPGQHPGESAGILTVLVEGGACLVQPAQRLDGSRFRSLKVGLAHAIDPGFPRGSCLSNGAPGPKLRRKLLPGEPVDWA